MATASELFEQSACACGRSIEDVDNASRLSQAFHLPQFNDYVIPHLFLSLRSVPITSVYSRFI